MSELPLEQHLHHPREYRENRFVYPVLSRRSGGISLGVNLNPDKVCNFDCIYCQVNRVDVSETKFVEMEQLLTELEAMFRFVGSGDIYRDAAFCDIPEPLRRLNDVAFSGDGEPTTYKNFDEIVRSVAALKKTHQKKWHQLDDVKMVLITNASMFHRPAVQRALELFDANNGEIWAKLDAGTEPYYQQVERTKIPFQRILENITEAAQRRAVVIQSLFMQINGEPPSEMEIDAFCGRLNDVIAAGGRISLVQVYTIARPPAESFVLPLSNKAVDRIAETVRSKTGLTTDVYYGG